MVTGILLSIADIFNTLRGTSAKNCEECPKPTFITVPVYEVFLLAKNYFREEEISKGIFLEFRPTLITKIGIIRRRANSVCHLLLLATSENFLAIPPKIFATTLITYHQYHTILLFYQQVTQHATQFCTLQNG